MQNKKSTMYILVVLWVWVSLLFLEDEMFWKKGAQVFVGAGDKLPPGV